MVYLFVDLSTKYNPKNVDENDINSKRKFYIFAQQQPFTISQAN